jgi:VWFA-related protein
MRSFLLLIFCMSALTAQEPPKAPGSTAPPPTVIRTGTQEVLLDVVVRDKNGKPVRDLEVKEIAVRDEGAPVKITGFRLVTGADAAGLGSEAAVGPKVLDPLRQVRLVSLVFERLDNDGRRLARQASLEFLKTELEQNVYIAVFIIDQRLHVLQQSTNDRELLRRAVDLASTTQYSQFAAQSDAIRKQLEDAVNKQATTAAAVATPPTGPGAGASGSNFGAGEAAAKMAQMTLNMLQFEESLSRVQQSRSSIFALLSLVRAQSSLPGRKTLIYFSEGLQVPDSMIETFNSTIGAANRAGVSVYAVDARGLTSEGQSGAGKSLLDSAVASSRAQQTAGSHPAPVTMDQARVFDTARDSVHANTQEALEELSANTGGFLVANTNDFRAPFRKVSEDVHAYYEVAYVPPITDYDGHFRKVSVMVDRPDVKVQTRSGYFALPPNENSVFAYEMPLLRALNSTPLPKDFPFHSAALRFGRENGNIEYGLVMEVPLKEVTFTEDKVSHNYRAHLSLVALFKDQRGGIVERFSRDLPIEEPADKLDALRHGHFIQTYHLVLAPGRYTLDSAVMDRESQKISARRTAVMVMAPRPGIGMSSLSLIRRIEPQSGDVDVQDPFHFDGGKVVPTLDNSVQASAGGELSYYFVIYTLNTVADKPQLTMEFIKDGTTVGQASPELPPAGKDGVIPYVAALPLTSFGPGIYELHTIIKQGSSVAEERTSFSINP